MTEATSAIAGAFLLSLGITATAGDFTGGMFLATSMAFLVMAWSRPEDRKSYWLTLVTAMATGVAAAVVHSAFVPKWSLHAMMMTAGMLSRYLAEGVLTFGKSVPKQMERIPEILRKRFIGTGDSDA